VTARSTSDEAPKGAKFIKGDVSTNEGAKAIAAATLQVLGGIDIIINNAGAARVHLQGTASIPDAEWQDALDMNFLSAVRVTNALLPALKESKAGAIVNLSSGGATSWPAHWATTAPRRPRSMCIRRRSLENSRLCKFASIP